MMPQIRPGVRALILCVLLLAAVFATFGRGIFFPFLAYDDGLHIYANEYVSPLRAEGIGHFWGVAFRPLPKLVQGRELPPYEQLYGPVTFTVWALLSPIAQLSPPAKTPMEAVSSPLNPAVYHLAMILVHGINAVLVFLLLRRLFRSDAVFFAALLWALHPLQVESVQWVTQLNTLLCCLFSLGATHLYLSFDRAGREGGGARWLPYIAGTGLLLLGLCSKPLAAVTLIVVAGVVFLDRRWNGDERPPTKSYAGLIPWTALCFVIVLVNKRLQQKGVDGPHVDLTTRFFQVGDSFAFYFWKLLLPFNLCTDYARRPEVIFKEWWGHWTWIVPFVVIIATILLGKRYPVLAVATAVFIGALLPTSGIVPYYFHTYSTVADRYAYFALLGPALLVAWLVAGTPGAIKKAWASAARALCAVLGIAFGGLSFAQSAVWQDDVHLWSQSAAISPESFLAANNLAVAYMRQNQNEQAIKYFRATLRLKAKRVPAHANLAKLLDENGPTPEGLFHIEEATREEPYNPDNQNQYAVALARRGRLAEAIHHWKLATKVDPELADAWINLGVALAMQNRSTEAIAAWRRATELKPESPELHYNLGIALEQHGDLEGARLEWARSLQANPNYVQARRALERTGGAR